VLGREGMDEAKLDAILARQMKNEEKVTRAHFVVDTGQGLDHARAQVRDILATLRSTGVPALAQDSKASH
jgi:dephospho-CoA kinase